jgi:hypothetical protein
VERLALALASGEADPTLRDEILNSEGVPGIVRMLSYLVPASVVLALTGLMAGMRLSKLQVAFMMAVSLLALGVRSVVYMDRQPIFMTALLIAAVVAERVRWTARRVIGAAVVVGIVGVAGLVLASMLAQVRGGELVEQNTILHYADLGVANAIMAMRTTTQFSLGGNSVWTPLSFVPRGIGLPDLPLPSTDSDWVWNPAANLLCHSYQDFGPLGFVTYALQGVVVGFVCNRRVRQPTSLTWASGYLWCIFGLLGTWTIPVMRGTEFWAAVLSTTFVSLAIDRRSRRLPFRGLALRSPSASLSTMVPE